MLCSSCSAVVRPIVCLDLDGTLGDYHRHFSEFCIGYFGRPFMMWWDGHGDWEDYLGITQREYREAKLAFRQVGGKRTMPIFDGARELASQCQVEGAEVWITTTRPWNRLDSTDPDTQEWLNRHRIRFDHLLYDDDKYGKLAEIVDPARVVAVLDDLPEQYDRAATVFGPEVPVLRLGNHNRWASTNRTTAPNLSVARDKINERINSWNLQETHA